MAWSKRVAHFPLRRSGDCEFGYNADLTNISAIELAAAGGATSIRYHPGWENQESYSTGEFSMSAALTAGLTRCGELGVKPTLVAGYGPPRSTVATLTVTAATAAGAKVIPVSGALAAIEVPYCHLARSDGNIDIATKRAYYGALITAVDTQAGTVTIAAPTTVDLAQGATVKVNRLRYPSIASTDPDDPSVQAFIRYCEWLADRIATLAGEGYVCLWNETLWTNDPWNARISFHDPFPTPTAGLPDTGRMDPILRAAQAVTLPAGVRFINGATDKSGSNGVVIRGTIDQATVARTVPLESIHPYGQNPEHHLWDPYTVIGNEYALIDSLGPSNFRWLARQNDLHRSTNGFAPDLCITETGALTANDTAQARFLLRQVLAWWGCGVSPVQVYSLTATGDLAVAPGLTPRPAYTALQRLTSTVSDLGGGGTAESVPLLVGWSGDRWQAASVGIYGGSGSIRFLWQRTTDTNLDAWATRSSPPPATATVQVAGEVAEVVNLRTGDAVTYTLDGSLLSVAVADDPIAIRTTR